MTRALCQADSCVNTFQKVASCCAGKKEENSMLVAFVVGEQLQLASTATAWQVKLMQKFAMPVLQACCMGSIRFCPGAAAETCLLVAAEYSYINSQTQHVNPVKKRWLGKPRAIHVALQLGSTQCCQALKAHPRWHCVNANKDGCNVKVLSELLTGLCVSWPRDLCLSSVTDQAAGVADKQAHPAERSSFFS